MSEGWVRGKTLQGRNMTSFFRFAQSNRLLKACTLALLFTLTAVLVAAAAAPTIQISSDPFTNSDSQHKTQVEPDSFSYGSTVVAVTQTGRYFDGGSSDIGYATSTDGGNTWMHDFLNCVTTKKATNCGSIHVYDRASDPSVAYDPKHNVWMAASLVLTQATGAGVEVSRSTDGGLTFGLPVVVDNRSTFHDKSWIACDTWSNSPFFGNCYVEWDDVNRGDLIQMHVSTDGGLTWSGAKTPAGSPFGLGGQPLAQPNGNVVVPYWGNGIQSVSSSDGGNTWSAPVNVANITDHFVAGNLRTEPLPSAEIDGDGKIYVVWQDCRFRSGCTANDIVVTTSTDGITWSSVTRIPTTALTSTLDVFIPGIAVDRNSHAPNVHIALTTYGYRNTSCSFSTCKLGVAFLQSTNGGKTWFGRQLLTGAMSLSWLPSTSGGYMVGDYISTSIANGKAFPLYELANAPSGGVFDESLYSVQGGLLFPPSGEQFSGLNDRPVPGAHSDHPDVPGYYYIIN